MDSKKDLNLFLQYVIPSMASMLIAGSFCIVDTIFIGHGIGAIGLAAVGLAWPVVFFFQAAADMIGSGAAVLIAQAHGEENPQQAQKIFSTLAWLQIVVTGALLAPFLFFLPEILRFLGATDILMPYALEYIRPMLWMVGWSVFMFGGMAVMRNDGSPVLAMWVEITALLGNIVLDWLFIIHFSWGAWGAACATIVSQAFACLIIIWYFLSRQTKLRFTRYCFRPDFQAVREIFLTGIPIFGNTLAILLMVTLHNYQALQYGGEIGLAAYTLVCTLEALGSLLMTGLAAGTQPIAAFLHGAGEHARKRHIGKMACWTSVGLGVAMFFLCCVLRYFMPGWAGLDGETAELAIHGVLLCSPAFLLLGLIRVASYYYQSTEQIAKSSLLIYGDGFFALPLCLFALPLWFSMDGVWTAMPVSRVILFVLLVFIWYTNWPGSVNPSEKISGNAGTKNQPRQEKPEFAAKGGEI